MFDWTLGELAVQYGAQSGYDYALFLYARDSFSSSGRVALQAVGVSGVHRGRLRHAAGRYATAFASLVDLKTGELVWFNYMQSPRRVTSARRKARMRSCATLLDSMSAEAQAKKRRA